MRVKKALHEDITTVPNVILYQKDHKPVNPDTGLPATRPVCEARTTFNQRANNHLVTILDGVNKSDPTSESISTEDMIASIDALNKDIHDNKIDSKNLMVGSLDVEALYPSINTKTAGRICKDKVMKSSAIFEGIDYKSAIVYLKLTMSPSEIVDSKIQHLLPRKKNRQGKKATILTADMEDKSDRWWHPTDPKKFSENDKRLIIGCITEQLVKLVFGSHFYMWDNVIYRQVTGAPMGLQSSCPVSRVMMDYWRDRVQDVEDRMEALATINPIQYEELKVHLLKKYVDDVLAALNNMKCGTRWDHTLRIFKWDQEEAIKDKDKDPQEITMSAFAAMASSQLECLNFTWDSPSNNANNKMPVLDTMVWVDTELRMWDIPTAILGNNINIPVKTGDLKRIIMYEFYKKPMSNKVPLHCRSAVPSKQQITTVSNEFLRRLKNTSRELPKKSN